MKPSPSYNRQISARLIRLPRQAKRLLMVAADLVILPLALLSAFALRLGEAWLAAVMQFWWLFPLAPLMTFPVFVRLGLYRAVVRFMGPQAVFAVLQGVTLSALVLGVMALLIDRAGFPRTVLVLYWLLALVGIGGSRFFVRAYLQQGERGVVKEPVVIYGAGAAGAQLASELRSSSQFEPVAFVDDDNGLWGSFVHGVRVCRPSALAGLIEEYGVSQVLLAIPSANRTRRRAIVSKLESLPVHVKTVPGLTDLVSGKAGFHDIRELDISDLLGRDPVLPDMTLLYASVRGKGVMVTGAGGSIGGELCRQILRLQPARLVLYERSEFALYQIDRELRALAVSEGLAVEIVPLLGDVADQSRVSEVISLYQVQTLYHAAAYKHVPIVEDNLSEGVRNNIFGTYHTALAAIEGGVETFVLISTDKAVRPTNVMGATKRFAELVLQGLAQHEAQTKFCMVRFGNVLDSSGSVVPLFREQIRKGGPVTVTHPEITRYFMTIPEAAGLVIQAGSMAKGGDVFVLDMGEPVRIVDLARKMIHLCGLVERDEAHPDGDIVIEYTGLRPGEKLYEELLIGDNVTGTKHPMIMRAEEASLSWAHVGEMLAQLSEAVDSRDCEAMRRTLINGVHGYVPSNELRDLVWACRQRAAKVTRLQSSRTKH